MNRNAARHCEAFTLIEMIGVLAVIAILASLLVPKIFEAINSAHLSRVQVGCQTVKTAALEHYGKFLSFASSNGVPFTLVNPLTNFDGLLMAEGLLDKPFTARMASSAYIQLRSASNLSGTNPGSDSSGYDLDGDGDNDIVGAQYLVEAILNDVSDTDALQINERIDGSSLSEEVGNSGRDARGRVIYDHQSGPHPREVRIYITHH